MRENHVAVERRKQSNFNLAFVVAEAPKTILDIVQLTHEGTGGYVERVLALLEADACRAELIEVGWSRH